MTTIYLHNHRQHGFRWDPDRRLYQSIDKFYLRDRRQPNDQVIEHDLRPVMDMAIPNQWPTTDGYLLDLSVVGSNQSSQPEQQTGDTIETTTHQRLRQRLRQPGDYYTRVFPSPMTDDHFKSVMDSWLYHMTLRCRTLHHRLRDGLLGCSQRKIICVTGPGVEIFFAWLRELGPGLVQEAHPTLFHEAYPRTGAQQTGTRSRLVISRLDWRTFRPWAFDRENNIRVKEPLFNLAIVQVNLSRNQPNPVDQEVETFYLAEKPIPVGSIEQYLGWLLL